MRDAAAIHVQVQGLIPVIIVGLGSAGSRFARACLALNMDAQRLKIIAGVDVDAVKRVAFECALGIPCFGTIEEAALTVQPTLAIVTVSEHQHFQILLELKRYFPSLQRILCEKPLTATVAEARLLPRTFDNQELSLNFVERFSPIVASLQDFMKINSRVVLRANCMWGKYRVKDPRPTLGVVPVELAHPLDLVLMLAQVQPGTGHSVTSVVATRSNFSTGNATLLPLDTIHVALEFAHGLQVLISTSLLWSQRQRKIELLLADATGMATELAVLEFDNPMWDIDRLEIHDIRANGGMLNTLLSEDITAADWPDTQRTIGKVCRFVNANLDEINGQMNANLPRLDQGVYVQELMESISDAANMKALQLTCFADPEAMQKHELKRHLECLAQMASGTTPDAEALTWDSSF